MSYQDDCIAFREMATRLCAALGWSLDPRFTEPSDCFALLQTPCGKWVALRVRRGRMSITGCYPGTAHSNHTEAEHVEINLNASRSPEALAKDIKRRFWPEFERSHAAACEYVRKIEEFNRQTKEILSQIVEMVGGRALAGSETTFRRYANEDGIHVEGQVTGERVRLNIEASFQTLRPLLAQLQGMLRPTGADEAI
jgi:hypothetical protein